MDLYTLLPNIVKNKDTLGSGGTSSGETILQKLFYAINQEVITTENFTSGLQELLQPETCPKEYLPLLEYFLGSQWPATWSEAKQRLLVGSLVKLYHHSGQRLSWVALLNLMGYAGYFPWELWKDDVYEDIDYSISDNNGDYYNQYHAARIDIRKADTTFKALSDAEKSMIENFRPIHVLFRHTGIKVLTQNDNSSKSVTEVLAANSAWGMVEEFAIPTDSLSIVQSCIALCEVGAEP